MSRTEAGGARFSWPVWARGLSGLTPTESLVVVELARLADWRGEAIVSVAHLVEVTGRSRASVFRALSSLEAAGHVARARRRTAVGQGANSYVLNTVVPPPEVCEAPVPLPVPAASDRGSEEVIVSRDDNDGLRSLVEAAQDEGWSGPFARALAATVVEIVPIQFAGAVRRAQVLAGMTREEAVLDTTTRAWELLVQNVVTVLAARAPWAMWTRIVSRASYEVADVSDCVSTDPALLPDRGLRPGDGATEVDRVAFRDIGPTVGAIIDALVASGMPETIAWAGTRRIAELALKGASRRHTLAAEDPRLADLDVTPECARAWMTLLTGSRRGATGGVLDLSEADLRARAREVARAWLEAA